MEAIWITASPRDPATGLPQTVRMAGGGPPGFPFRRGGQHYRAGLVRRPRFTAKLEFAAEGWTGGTVPTTGKLAFLPAEKNLIEELAALYWNDAEILVEAGPAGGDYETVLAGTVVDCLASREGLLIEVADLSQALNKPVATGRFAGDGGIEGGLEAAGRVKRRSWGRVFNVEGRILDKVHNIFEFGDPAQPLQAIGPLRDMGRDAAPAVGVVAWQGNIDDTLAALVASSPAEGSGVVAPSIACAKWWTQPAGPLTADLEGEIGAGYVETAPEIAAALIAAAAGPAIDNVAAMAATRPEFCGLHIGDANETAAAALDRLLLGVSMLWVLDPAGTIELREIAFGDPAGTIRSSDARRTATFPPTKLRRVGYRRSQRVHNDGEIASILLFNRGQWAAETDYYAGENVADNGSSWTARVNHTSSEGNRPPALPTSENATWRLNSAAGANGINTATIHLYQRAATSPAVPASDLTYTFATGGLAGTLGSWTRAVPGSNGHPLWVTTAPAIGAGATDLIEPGDWSAPAIEAEDGANGGEPWRIDYLNGVAREGSRFTKTSGTGWGNSAAKSYETKAQASISFRDVSPTMVTDWMVALTADDTDDSYTHLDYAVHGTSVGAGEIQIYENGTPRGTFFASRVTTDVFTIRHRGAVVEYLKNGVVFYTSTVVCPADTKMRVDSAFYTNGAAVELTPVMPLSPGSWSAGAAPHMRQDGATFEKVSGGDSWINAVHSIEKLAQARVSYVPAQTNKALYFSLADTAGSHDYGVYAGGDGNIYAIRNADVDGSALATYAAGDTLWVEHRDDTVLLGRTTAAGATSVLKTYTGVSPTALFRLAGAFYSQGGRANNVSFSATGQANYWIDVKWRRSNAKPSTPTGASPSGWFDAPPAGTETLWKSRAMKLRSGALIGTWSEPTKDQGSTPRGAYSGAATYYLDNTVTFNGGTYIATQDNFSGQAPSGTAEANSYWDVVAAPGAPGEPGTPPSAFSATIDLTSLTGLTNLRSIADANGYTGLSDATVTFRVPNGVTLRGLAGSPNGGGAIDTGTWPTGSYAIALTIVVQAGGIVDGGGGRGGDGGYTPGAATPGGNGGDAIYCRLNVTGGITIDAGGTVRGGGGGGGGGEAGEVAPFPEPLWDNGGGGGGGAPNGPGGSPAGSAGTTSGGGAGETPSGVGGAGGAGGTFATAGSGSGAAGGSAGFAVRKNGHTVTVTNNGTMTGSAA